MNPPFGCAPPCCSVVCRAPAACPCHYYPDSEILQADFIDKKSLETGIFQAFLKDEPL